jgi:adenine deaminase
MIPRITEEEILTLIKVAQGQEPADLVLQEGKVLNVYSGEILEQDVVIKGSRIAYVGDARQLNCPPRQVIDVSGLLLSPGYFDPHAHAELVTDITSLSQAILPLGTTALFCDSRYIGFTLGAKGMELLRMEADAVPLKVCFGIPATTPSFPDLEGKAQMDLSTYNTLLKQPDLVSLSEVYQWIQINRQEENLIHRFHMARSHGKRIEGHLPGASPHAMTPSVIAGLTSDHEAITAQEALDRLRMGLHVMLRHGSIRDDLPTLAALLRDYAVDTSRVMLTPDFMYPRDILTKGYMNYVIRTAIELDIPPIKAYQMCTLNPARYFHLDDEMGAISPGKLADLLVLRDIHEPTPLKVMVNGQWVSEGKKLLTELKRPDFPFSTYATLDVKWILEDDLEVKANSSSSQEVPVIIFSDKTITRLDKVTLPVKNGLVLPDPDQMVQKVAMPRTDGTGVSVAFIKGFTRNLGAISIGVCHDSVLPFVAGSNDRDMAVAFHWLAETGGGVVIIHNGQLLFDLPFPLGGVASDLPVDLLADRMDEFVRILREFGCPLADPFMTFLFIPFTALPYVRMTPSGLLDVIPFKIIDS